MGEMLADKTDENHVRAVLRLHLAEGVGAITFKKLVDEFGDAEKAVEAGLTGWKRVEGIGATKSQATFKVLLPANSGATTEISWGKDV